eukprot:1731459-Ditylum_brightwellii.AAC.1
MMMSSKHDQVTSMAFFCSTQYDGRNSSRQGSGNDLLRCYHQKYLSINLLRVNEEGDETSEEEMKA